MPAGNSGDHNVGYIAGYLAEAKWRKSKVG